jgi:hypothetical protein
MTWAGPRRRTGVPALSLPVLLMLLLPVACERGGPPSPAVETRDAPSAADTAGAGADGTWPSPGVGRIDVGRERRFDFTGDGTAERVAVRATGTRYDSLAISLRIETADGAVLWADDWNSSYYFYYDSTEGRTAEEIARVVREHVERLVDDERFHDDGMPPRVIGGDPAEMTRESVRYHLAELDWRRGASLDPVDPTPPQAERRMRPEGIAQERVQVVAEELSGRPTYNYFAGGEATYVIGWSVREQAFVRLFACC